MSDVCPKWMKDDFADWFLREITALGRWQVLFAPEGRRNPWADYWAASVLPQRSQGWPRPRRQSVTWMAPE